MSVSSWLMGMHPKTPDCESSRIVFVNKYDVSDIMKTTVNVFMRLFCEDRLAYSFKIYVIDIPPTITKKMYK